MTDPKDRFARAAGVEAREVVDFADLAVDSRHLQLGVVPQTEGPACLAVGSASKTPVVLGDADRAEVLALLDLRGAGFTLALSSSPIVAPTPPVKAAAPAALVRLKQTLGSGEDRHTLVLCSLDADPRVLWTERSRSLTAGRGGFDSFELAFEGGGGAPLGLAVLQSTVPGRSNASRQPGPPLRLHFAWREDRYVRRD
ncbi:MAG: hypothetical protein IT457_20230 [Planctomycetes bacterium]|nr:hypothetical protein [Planctomycetota bacterium]